jgi:NADH:ubiquinone oxidoreductase subunit F (NADH-binding)/(2Fe-2S) ferredoxin/Pyruvate/2-oxoacid:ferredoxin oxidoreductase delta subunit
MSPVATESALSELRAKAAEAATAVKSVVRVCTGTGCTARGAEELLRLFHEAAAGADASVGVTDKCVGCHGLCELGPIVTVEPAGVIYVRVEEPDVDEIFRETVLSGKVVDRLLYKDPESGESRQAEADIPFYATQKRIVLAGNGVLDPESLDDYLNAGGFEAYEKALQMAPEDIVAEVTEAGLRGRGGGGFPTGRKWASCRAAAGDEKIVICNGDEGDPGAFMDRSIMEGNPFSVLEGLMIGARAIGASRGYIYVRNEYPLAVARLTKAIDTLREAGLLGASFDVRINRGGGAFVCGESTALIASLEGRAGEPRTKYVHTVESGLRGLPTVLNNVETWANVPAIIRMGAKAFASVGTKGSKGTKVFSLVGKVVNTGLVEVPMGISLRDLIFTVGGGVKDGKAFKAVQTGGPSGGCIPEAQLDARIDFDELTELGSMMGSGGVIVMDEDNCMVHVAEYFLTFLKEESCGKCTACREGIAQMLAILNRLCGGAGQPEDLARLEELCFIVGEGSLCALGQTAVNPVLTTLKYFRDEYESHAKDHRCPAKECKGLFEFRIDPETCTGCTLCAKKCPVDAISGEKKGPHTIDQAACTHCAICFEKCPFNAIGRV